MLIQADVTPSGLPSCNQSVRLDPKRLSRVWSHAGSAKKAVDAAALPFFAGPEPAANSLLGPDLELPRPRVPFTRDLHGKKSDAPHSGRRPMLHAIAACPAGAPGWGQSLARCAARQRFPSRAGSAPSPLFQHGSPPHCKSAFDKPLAAAEAQLREVKGTGDEGSPTPWRRGFSAS
jgi:hypothetical protein